MTNKAKEKLFEYDVCLSFAGEDRKYVEKVADSLRKKGVRIFFDEYEQINLWGKDLFSHLNDIYTNSARFCVLFISKAYAKKAWTNHERESAQARALENDGEYILPARFDKTEIPGLRKTTHYVNLKDIEPKDFAEMIEKKIKLQKTEFFPPVPDKLFKQIESDETMREEIYSDAYNFFTSLTRMSDDEKFVVFHLFLHCCPADLPENVHIEADLLRRITNFPIPKIKRILQGINSIGFKFYTKEDKKHNGEILAIEYHNRGMNYPGNATFIAHKVIEIVSSGFCVHHALDTLKILDFSKLAEITTKENNRCNHKSKRSRKKRKK